MYVTINTASEFMNEFHNVGRGEQFSFEALELLWHHYNELDDYELDVTEICCSWTEYGSQDEACEDLKEDWNELSAKTMTVELACGRVLVMNY